jgi:hypothetical protein
MLCPHPGYGPAPMTGMTWIGESYARALNRALFSTSDGTIFNYVLRKHVEIPACGAVLISKPLEGLKEYGYVDMVNCIIGEGDAVMDKVATLVADPERRQAVAQAGYELAHSRHTTRHCDQVYRWFLRHRELRPGESIIQHGTFGAFEAVSDGRSGAIPPAIQTNELTLIVEQAERDYRNGLLMQCLQKLDRVLKMKMEQAPARLLLVRALLMSGKPQEAAQNGHVLFDIARNVYQAPEPDPVEWAWWVITQVCRGDLNGANAALRAFPALCHSELRRAAWLLGSLLGRADSPPAGGRQKGDRPSVAVSLETALSNWLAEIEAMLRRCNQLGLAEAVSTLAQRNGLVARIIACACAVLSAAA